ncbi:hypothetical protein J5X07_11965 [Actinomyces bowdenii]|uniref:DNA mimic protein DMP19 C-terminal domain-containing protein n=1 Tax=Actinomyces bowdenii TaxID=131109 RepID=A0A3P1V814_9ACTO|nr:hypothetical protein [Actinomyces bowdenii]MBO3725731.1 hypothetical protein [Actinomyces bowdenii]RRD30344.1 hypothetical protein EII10_02730 [Actinomyces bowdenii]
MLIDRLRGQMLDHVVISAESARSADPALAVASNREVVDYLSDRQVPYEEMSAQAVGSYFVDDYLRLVLEGGMARFVSHSQWDGLIVSAIGRTLPLIGAIRHAEVFERLWEAVEEPPAAGPQADAALEALTREFLEAQAVEDLVELNAAFLAAHPRTELVDQADLRPFLDSLLVGRSRPRDPGQARPGARTHFEQAIDLFCEMRGMTLEAVSAGDPSFTYRGAPATAWHFLTDAGHFSVVDLGGTAVLFDEKDIEVATIDTSSLAPVA